MKNRILFLLLLSIIDLYATQTNDSIYHQLTSYVDNIQTFNRLFPQEKVYLHFDNTGYFKGDTLWYKCYVTTASENHYTDVSSVLYVELLTPEGNIVDTRKLKIEHGQCHGEFVLKEDYHSGFYEVRAYTRYMLNWSRDWTFSRVFPVFEKPETDRDYSKRVITGYQHQRKVPFNREKTQASEKVNVTFYPEGGTLVQGMTSRVAFKATDEKGQGIEVTGNRQDGTDRIQTIHQGMGVFDFCPRNKHEKIELVYNKKTYTFELPEILPEGYVMRLDNSGKDYLKVFLQKSSGIPPKKLGLSILCRGKVSDFRTLILNNDALFLSIPKDSLSAGVNQITLFDERGKILSERLFFVDIRQQKAIKRLTNSKLYKPFEHIQLDFQTEAETTFSLSVRDQATDVALWQGNILTDLLLSSDLKGYVQNPTYYFEESNGDRRKSALDLLMLVQGWRRYEWQQMTKGNHVPFLFHQPEKGLVLEGRVRSVLEEGDADWPNGIDRVELRLEQDIKGQIYRSLVKLDTAGSFRLLFDDFDRRRQIRFSILDIEKKDTIATACRYSVLLDRVFSPLPRAYSFFDTAIRTPAVFSLMDDTKEKSDITKVQILPEISVFEKNKRQTFLTYQVDREKALWRDQGIAYPESLYDYLKQEGVPIKKVYRRRTGGTIGSKYTAWHRDPKTNASYKYFIGGTEVQLVAYRSGKWKNGVSYIFNRIPLDEIQRINIYDSKDAYKSVVDYGPLHRIPQGKLWTISLVPYAQSDSIDRQSQTHIRTTKLEGYSVPKAFYAGKNPPLPGDVDYRRTLYWNPDVKTDGFGKASVDFYNNGTCRKIAINAEGLTKEGEPCVLKE
jgi:hypothetical protein